MLYFDYKIENITYNKEIQKTMSPKLSICVPRISNDITKFILFESFRKLFIGRIERIDIVTNKKTQCRRAFIHYKHIYDTESSQKIVKTLENGDYIKLVYSFPDYWKCYISRIKKPELEI